MTPKEKAEELFNKYRPIIAGKQFLTGFVLMSEAKELTRQCAIIAVDEIIEERYFHNEHYQQNSKLKYHIEIELAERLESTRNYWGEVKHEIEKL